MKSYSERCLEFQGQNVSFICARYHYYGIVSEVGTDHVVLSNVSAIEQSGQAMAPQPTVWDPIPSSITIRFDAIETMFQPLWGDLKRE